MKERNYIRYPYEELAIVKDEEPDTFIFSTPWAQARITFDSLYTYRVEKIASIISSNRGIEHIDDVSWLMEQVERFPFSYILPRSTIQYTLSDTIERPAVSDFLSSFEVSMDYKFDWEWDIKSTLMFSQSIQKQHYDPVTILTILRRYHFLNFAEKDKAKQLYDYIQTLKSSTHDFKYACAVLIRQNHYVTEKCVDVLTPALGICDGKMQSKVEEFIASETGHDVILSRALFAIGYTPPEIPVVGIMVSLMALFKVAAKTNFLAFALMIDMFEGRAFEESNYFSEFLTKHGLAESAKQLDIHDKINHNGNHDNIALELLLEIKTVQEEQVIEAMGFAEIASNLLTNLSNEIRDVLVTTHDTFKIPAHELA